MIDCSMGHGEDHEVTVVCNRSRQRTSTAQPPVQPPASVPAPLELAGPSAVASDLTLIAQLSLPATEETVKHTVCPCTLNGVHWWYAPFHNLNHVIDFRSQKVQLMSFPSCNIPFPHRTIPSPTVNYQRPLSYCLTPYPCSHANGCCALLSPPSTCSFQAFPLHDLLLLPRFPTTFHTSCPARYAFATGLTDSSTVQAVDGPLVNDAHFSLIQFLLVTMNTIYPLFPF